MGTLAGKVALVTGGSSGIGLASAEELIREGAFVYITGRKKAELDAAANRLGERCVSIQADISKMEDIDRIYKKIAGDGKALDVLFANAGGGSFAPLGSITEEQYDATFTTNVKGTLFTVQKSLPHLNDGSSIILNASIASVKGIPGLSVYSAAKAALRSFARVWMMDLRQRRIRVNVISPGPTDTPGFRAAAGSTPEDLQRFVETQASGVPTGRIGEAWEIARAVVFLAGKDSAFINGIELFVDGDVTQIRSAKFPVVCKTSSAPAREAIPLSLSARHVAIDSRTCLMLGNRFPCHIHQGALQIVRQLGAQFFLVGLPRRFRLAVFPRGSGQAQQLIFVV